MEWRRPGGVVGHFVALSSWIQLGQAPAHLPDVKQTNKIPGVPTKEEEGGKNT